jgi:hypothetical protein
MTTTDGQNLLSETVSAFARNWFDLLSAHEPVERLLRLVVDDGLEMVFPERTLRGHADFSDWYGVVGRSFADQSHQVERLGVAEDGDRVDVDVVVIWRATQVSDGSKIAVRANQDWRLIRAHDSGELRIARYRVLDMTDI